MEEGFEYLVLSLLIFVIGMVFGILVCCNTMHQGTYKAQVNAVSARPDGAYDIVILHSEEKKTFNRTCSPATAKAVKVGQTYIFKDFRWAELYLYSNLGDEK